MAKGKSFTSILTESPTSPVAPAAGAATNLPKAGAGGRPTNRPRGFKVITLHVDDDLNTPLDRMVFWRGKGSSQREVINDALREYAAKNPDAERSIPGEQA